MTINGVFIMRYVAYLSQIDPEVFPNLGFTSDMNGHILF